MSLIAPACRCALMALLLCCAPPAKALWNTRYAKAAFFNWTNDALYSATRAGRSAGEIIDKQVELKQQLPDRTEWNALRAEEERPENLKQNILVASQEDDVFPPIMVTSNQWDGADKPHGSCPSMFVVVMSRRENIAGRLAIRDMWKEADVGWGTVPGGVRAKFGLCQRPADDEVENASLQSWLTNEAEHYGDVLFLGCKEGYLHGQLTRKLLASMSAYLTNYSSYELFMKTDDDAFVSTRRLCDFLSTQPANENHFKQSYMGVFAEIGEYLNARKVPCRDATSNWYEPFSKFNSTTYPMSAKGGPGYILSRSLVSEIIANRIAHDYVLNNEDKAVGVWIDALKRRGQKVDYINLPGTDGYDEWHPLIRKSGAWAWYPYVVHHHLEGSEIACLHKVDKGMDRTRPIDSCFQRKTTQLTVLRAQPSQDQKPHNLEGRRGESHLNEQLAACLGA